MAAISRSLDRPSPRLGIPLWLIGAALALALGVCVGDPGPETVGVLSLLLAGAVLFAVSVAPFAGYLVLVTSSIMLVVVSIGTGERNITSFDVLQLPLLAVTVLGGAAASARQIERAELGPAHDELRAATRRFTDAVWIYLALAAASLLVTVAMGKPAGAIDSGLKLVRGFQGMLMFPLGMIWLKDERGFRQAIGAIAAGGAIFAIVNAFALVRGDTIRAGMTWFANEPLWSIGDPIEAGTSMLLVWVVLMARQSLEPRGFRSLALGVVLVLLVLSQSRSGLLAWITFTALSLRRVPWRNVLLGLLLLLVVGPALSSGWWQRMARTVVLERGSFEAFSSLIRVYGWRAALLMFRDHPLFGVGYVGFRHFSDRYNELGIVLGQAESMYFETATGMGLVGLAALGLVLKRLYALGATVRRHARPGSFAAALGEFHAPYLTGLMVANLTGDNWVGLVGLAQVAIWCALLVRSGHLAIGEQRPA